MYWERQRKSSDFMKNIENISLIRFNFKDIIRDFQRFVPSYKLSLYFYMITITEIIKSGKILHLSKHFTRKVFADILVPKYFNPKTQLCNFWHQNLYKKCASKHWWNWLKDMWLFIELYLCRKNYSVTEENDF